MSKRYKIHWFQIIVPLWHFAGIAFSVMGDTKTWQRVKQQLQCNSELLTLFASIWFVAEKKWQPGAIRVFIVDILALNLDINLYAIPTALLKMISPLHLLSVCTKAGISVAFPIREKWQIFLKWKRWKYSLKKSFSAKIL